MCASGNVFLRLQKIVKNLYVDYCRYCRTVRADSFGFDGVFSGVCFQGLFLFITTSWDFCTAALSASSIIS